MKLILSFILMLTALIGCTAPESAPVFVVGESLSESEVRILSIDTFSLELSTFKFDSIITSQGDRLLVGRYEDSIFGEISASSYLELTTTDFDIPSEGELDSIAVILGYDQYFYSDTTRVAQINIHEVLEEVRPDQGGVFFNTTEIEFQPLPIGTAVVQPEPQGQDSLNVKIPLAFGQDLFDKIQSGAVSDNFDLVNELKGISIRPADNTNASIIGFNTAADKTYLRFYYSVENEFGRDEFSLDLRLNPVVAETSYFNSISGTLEGTGLEAIIEDQEINLPSSQTGNRSFIHSGLGIATRVQFPSIRNLYDIPGEGTLLGGQLLIRPDRNSFDGLTPLPDSLRIGILDQNNEILRDLTNGDGEVYGLLKEDGGEFDQEIYEIPVGVYLEQKLLETVPTDDALVLYTASFGNDVSRMVLSGENNEQLKAQLVITYAIYDPQ